MADAVYDPKDFWRNGFCIVPDAFPVSRVTAWRAAASDHDGRDLFTHPVLRDIVTSDVSLNLAKRILDAEEILFFGDSNPIIGPTAPGFHKDNADKADDAAPDWQGRYPIIRFGLYTDDHGRFPGGLDLRRGSHLSASVSSGTVVSVRSQPGDLVIWNLRTSHSGGTILSRNGHAVDPSSVWGKLARRPPFNALFAPELPDRTALFWTYATPGTHLERYISYLKTRRYAVDRWRRPPYPTDWVEEAAAKGLSVRDVSAELVPGGAVHADHVPLPY